MIDARITARGSAYTDPGGQMIHHKGTDMAQKEPTGLQDAIRAQQAVINQLADAHALALGKAQAAGVILAAAHANLTTLLAKQAAE